MPVECTTCHGTGRADETRDEHGHTETCPECGGTGVVEQEEQAVQALGIAWDEAKERIARLLRAAGVRP